MPPVDSGQSAVEYYERLRREAAQGHIRNGPGLNVLTSRGMIALMHLVEHIPKYNQPKPPFLRESAQPLLLHETEKQIVQLLAAMVLGRHQEVMHVC